MKHHLAGGLLVALGLAMSAWGADPLAGTWKVIPEKSKGSTGQPGPKAEVVYIKEQGANLIATIKGTSATGNVYSSQFSVPKQGGHVTYISTAPPTRWDEIKRIDEHTMDGTMIRDGKVVGTVHATISPDGKTFTLVSKGTDAQGRPIESVQIQERQ
jgi:hypothetical protein